MAPKNREEGERTQKNRRRENQHEKGEGRMSLKKHDTSL